MKLSFQEKVGYGFGDLASNLVFFSIIYYLTYFYTDIFGIPAATVGTLFLLTRIWDAINDPIMGAIADRTNSKWGKFRPYLLYMAIPFGIWNFICYLTPELSATGKVVYASIAYVMLMMIYTAINIPYSALSAVMTDDSVERTGLNAYRMFFAQVGRQIVAVGVIPLVGFLGRGNEAFGYQMSMLSFGIIGAILFFICFSWTRERITPPVGQKSSFKVDMVMLLKNRPWQVVFIMGILTFSIMMVQSSVLMYYFKYYIGNQGLFSVYNLMAVPPMLLAIVLVKPLVMKFGKRVTFVIGQLGALAIIAIYYLPPDAIYRIFAANIIYNFFHTLPLPIIWAFIADTADYAEWKFNVRSTGIVFSAATFSHKFGMGIGSGLAGWLLDFFGYVPNVEQCPETINGILLMMSYIPAAFILVTASLMFFYKLDDKACLTMQNELAARRNVSS